MANEKVKLVKARVKKFNSYGPHRAGEVIDIDPAEVARVPHCLITLEDEADLDRKARAAEIAAQHQGRASSEMFEKNKAAQVAALEQAKAVRALNLQAQSAGNRKDAARLTGTAEE